MTQDDDRTEARAEWDAMANTPRPGWKLKQKLDSGIEIWTRKQTGLAAHVLGHSQTGGAGYWWFSVERAGDVITSGESSRRGFAMDGADESFQTVN